MRKVSRRLFCILAIGFTAIASSAIAQGTYPSAPVRMVYGYATGGGDVIARLLAARLSAQMSANVFVENKPGASANIANEYVAKSKPDGYALSFNDSAVVLSPALGEKMGYDPFKELVPVSFVASQPFALVAHTSVLPNTAAEFVSYLRANPDKTTYGSAGIGTANHMWALLLLQQHGLTALHVPFKGGAPMMLDVAAGRVQWTITAMIVVVPMVKEKRIKALAFGGLKRSPLLPDVPLLSETVMPGLEVGNWYAVMAPAGTPPAIVSRLNSEIMKALQDPNTKGRIEEQGADPRGSTTEEYAAYMKGEYERWSRVVKTGGIKIE